MWNTVNSYEINHTAGSNDYKISVADTPGVSDLDTPMIWNVVITPERTSCSVELQFVEDIQNLIDDDDNEETEEVAVTVESAPITLFSVYFEDIDLTPPNNQIHLQYDSNTGLVTFTQGNKQRLLTLLSTNSKGEYFVKSLQANTFLLPGKFNGYNNYNSFKFSFNTDGCSVSNVSINCYARTNLL